MKIKLIIIKTVQKNLIKQKKARINLAFNIKYFKKIIPPLPIWLNFLADQHYILSLPQYDRITIAMEL